MDHQKIKSLFAAFSRDEQVVSWKSFGKGNINDTFLIRTEGNSSPDYILQRKNHLVFKDIQGMVNNIVLATSHIRAKLIDDGEQEVDRKVMTYYPAADGNYFTRDETGNYWALFLFIKDSFGVEEVTNNEQSYSTGKAFGRFQQQLADFDSTQLIETIPGFHNGILRFNQFQQSIKENKANRLSSIQDAVNFLLSRSEEMLKLQQWLDSGVLPLRITHNDSKINNILYDENSRILCIIDLDTVMPGTVLFDVGDAIRTMGNSTVEDDPDLSKIHFQQEYFDSFCAGYLSEANQFLLPIEKHNLVFGCRYMVWEQAMRFLTDYLNGDTYYKINHKQHNRDRTLNQVRYLEVMENNTGLMQQTVDQYS